jgi:hypothetical protein
MKKLIFLLLMAVVLTGFVFAGAAHPPWATGLEAVMAEYGVQQGVVTQPSVLVMAMPVTAEPASFQAVMALYNDPAIRPQSGFMNIPSMPAMFGQACTGCAAGCYYLRC